MPELFSVVATAGLGLALGLGALYLVLRGTAWRPGGGDPVRAVRVHGMVTALIAVFASGTAGYHRLAQPDGTGTSPDGPTGPGTVPPGGGEHVIPTGEAALLPWAETLLTVAGPAVGLVLVYAVAQYTWPRQTGPVRSARLADRRATRYLPRALAAVAVGVSLLAAGAVALAWTTPGIPGQGITGSFPDGPGAPGSQWTETGHRAGSEFAPWLLLALVLVVLGYLVVLAVVARRPPLGGLHPHDDHLVRQVTVNRALRTAVLMLWGVANAAVQGWAQAHHALARSDHDPLPEAVPGVPDVVAVVEPAAGVTGAALMLAMLFWRSPALRRLGDQTVATLSSAPDERSPGRPGTVEAVRRLRRESITVAWTLGTIAAVVTAGPVLTSARGWHPVWAGAGFGAVLAVYALYEAAIRRGHCPSPRTAPPSSGTTPRWAWGALGASLVLAGAWCVLGLATALPQAGPAASLAVTTAVLALGAIGGTRLSLRRPPLGRATEVQDEAVRSAGAERILAAGAAGITLVTALACLSTAQVWHGFAGGSRPVPGIDELPGSLAAVRLVTVLALACLSVAFLLGPSVRAAGAEADEPAGLPVHR